MLQQDKVGPEISVTRKEKKKGVFSLVQIGLGQ